MKKSSKKRRGTRRHPKSGRSPHAHRSLRPQTGRRNGAEEFQWNGVENIGILDPLKHLADSVEITRSGADAPVKWGEELIDSPAVLNHQFRVTEVFTLPTMATMEAPAGLLSLAP